MLERIKKFFQEAQQEWRHVNWPSRSEGIYLTTIVIVLSLAMAAFLGAFDYFFLFLLRTFVS